MSMEYYDFGVGRLRQAPPADDVFDLSAAHPAGCVDAAPAWVRPADLIVGRSTKPGR